jgi:hypothetical protein
VFIAHLVFKCLLCSLHLWFVEFSLEMDAFKLLDSCAYELAIVRSNNLVVNKLENFILSKEVLQV